jgi:small subunit ribosomal protein S3
MTRRSTRLMRLENSLYTYDPNKESWNVREVETQQSNENIFDSGSYFTCKHMSQKVNPISFRINRNKTWNSNWYSNYKNIGLESTKLQKDLYIREYLTSVFNKFKTSVDKIQIKEHNNIFFVKVFIYNSGSNQRQNILKRIDSNKRTSQFIKHFLKSIGHNSLGHLIIDLDKVLIHSERQLTRYLGNCVYLSVSPLKNICESASILSDHLSTELERPNSSFKKVLKDSLSQIRDKELIRGIRVNCSGRLGRAPMAKMEWFKFGSIPSNKISANIDYSYSMGKTKYGSFGIKVWLYKS